MSQFCSLIQLKYPKLSVALVVMLVIKNLVIKLVFITFLMITIVFLPFKLCIHVIELNSIMNSLYNEVVIVVKSIMRFYNVEV